MVIFIISKYYNSFNDTLIIIHIIWYGTRSTTIIIVTQFEDRFKSETEAVTDVNCGSAKILVLEERFE